MPNIHCYKSSLVDIICGLTIHAEVNWMVVMLLFLFQLTVIQGDIVKMAADAIVHPTNSSLYMGGEVGK